MSAIKIGGGCDEPASLDATFALDRGQADEVEGNVLEDGKVMGGMAGARSRLVIGKGNIHAPVQGVLDF